jgi:phosphatidylglycerophosphatase GEP4
MDSVLEYLGCKPSEIVVLGDRYFTDIMFGNLHGSLTIYTDPLTSEGENVAVRVVCSTHFHFIHILVSEG